MRKSRMKWVALGALLLPLAGCNAMVGGPMVGPPMIGPDMGYGYEGGPPIEFGPSFGDFGDFGGYAGLGGGMFMGDDDD
jgi:hypothetical protein